MKSSRLKITAFLIVAAGFFLLAGSMQSNIKNDLKSSEIITPETENAMKTDPQLAVLKAMPGGLRVLGINYFWIRSQQLHQAGRHFDAYDLAKIICQLQPNKPGVWDYQAWNMAWNISVECKTKEERWRWIYNAVKLLRDQGIRENPHSITLYKQLSWIFLNKMGDSIDDMHMSYKQRWASKMQLLLGAPDVTDLKNASGENVYPEIIAMRKIAEAPLDRNKAIQGHELIQSEMLKELYKDAEVNDYLMKFAQAGLKKVGLRFLNIYNDFSTDYSASSAWRFPFKPHNEQWKTYSKLINLNDPASKRAREKILSFLRAQILWNRYKMDPKIMLSIMEDYNLPLDWRHVKSHALYWSEVGNRVAQKQGGFNAVNNLNNIRYILFATKDFVATGRVTVRFINRRNLNYPEYTGTVDLRFIQPTIDLYSKMIDKEIEATGNKRHRVNSKLASGLVNFCEDAMLMLVADGQNAKAQKIFKFCKANYVRKGYSPDWDFESVEEFATSTFGREKNLREEVVKPIIYRAIRRALIEKAFNNNQKAFEKQFKLAKNFYKAFQKSQYARYLMKFSFNQIFANELARMIMQPYQYGLSLTPSQRSDLYLAFSGNSEFLYPVYDIIANYQRDRDGKSMMQKLCRFAKPPLDFNAAFPKPNGFDEYIKRKRRENQNNIQTDEINNR